MSSWRNWSGRNRCRPDRLHFIRTKEDARAIVRECALSGLQVRVAGAGHSHSPIVQTDGVILDSSGLSGVLDVDNIRQRAWIRAGSPIYTLGAQLHQHGLALKNQGDIDRQFLGGAISTGTHGTGIGLQNLAASVTGLRLILGDGEYVQCDSVHEPELFQAARLGIGSIGVIMAIEMELRTTNVLKESSWQADFEEFYEDIPLLSSQHERFEFFWHPQSDKATIKVIDRLDAEPQYPLADEGKRQAYSFEVLPSHRPQLHTEMEYSVPGERGLDCLQAIVSMIRTDFPEVVWPVEYRTVAADDVWLSMAYNRPTVTISVHQDVRESEDAYFRACEEIFREHDGRPHWGKVNYLHGKEFASIYPRWDEWWKVRDKVDPKMIFLNSWAKSIRP